MPVTYDTRRPAPCLYHHLLTDLHVCLLGPNQTKDILHYFYFSSTGFIVHLKFSLLFYSMLLCQGKTYRPNKMKLQEVFRIVVLQ